MVSLSLILNQSFKLRFLNLGSLLYHGPTSIYQDDFPDTSMETEAIPPQMQLGPLGNSVPLDEPFIEHTLVLFFRWQYSQFMFVYREAFLSDHFQHAFNGRYWSPPLLYALCALGAIMSPEPEIRQKADLLALQSQQMLLGFGIEQPHITFVQALLCLAFYYIGQGNYSKGWSLSGKS
jgi:hypothetical protein